jgi:D-galactonate transporter
MDSNIPAALDTLYAKVARRILPVLLLGYIAAYLDRVNVGFAKLQMLDDLQFSQTVYGLGAGIFFIGYFIFEVPSNILLHRLGARVWLARIMISWGVISAAMMFVETPASFYALRFLLGVAEAGFFPGVIYYLTQWFPAARRGRNLAIFMTGIAISSFVGSLLSGWIMGTFAGVHGLAGWQWMFLLEAIPAILLGFYLWFRLDNDVLSAKWLSEGEKRALAADLAQDAAASPSGSYADAFRDGRVWFGCLIYFCLVVGLYGISFWLPSIISDLGFKDPLQVGVLSAIPYAFAAVGMILVGRSSDRHRERRWHVAVPAAFGVIGLVASVLLADHVVLAITALTLATLGVMSGPPLFWNIPTAYLSGATAAAGIAIINSFGNLAGFVAPYLVGWIKDSTGSTAMGIYGIAAFLLLGAALVVLGIPARLVNR